MKKVFLLYYNYFTRDGSKLTIGGVQTYIKMLCEVIRKIGMTPIIYQYADKDFRMTYNNVEVNGVYVKESWRLKKKNKIVFQTCKSQYDPNEDIIIFVTDTMIVKNKERRVICIQHGISWDVGSQKEYSNLKRLLVFILRSLNSYKIITRLKNVKLLIGVDYNFLNWYKTQVVIHDKRFKIIPNCTKICNFDKYNSDEINIIFSRRFFEYRGTKLFAAALNQILANYDKVKATFAGNGPDEVYLRNLFSNNPRVNFISYNEEESFEIHKNYKIAVVPSLGSEGTSLSLLEAMAAKCAVIATNVGGMTNIVIDNFNGLLINPTENELYFALERLIIDEELRNRISENAYKTVSQAFNRELWDTRWINVLTTI